jgi:hypothetical protein
VAHVVDAHDASHLPSTHASPAPQSVSYLHAFVDVVQTPLTHVMPPLQSAFAAHAHGPFAPPHDWHLPCSQAWPEAQSAPLVHCGGASAGASIGASTCASVPPSPPAGETHAFATHCLPPVQSAVVVHSFLVPGFVPGATHRFDEQTAPCGQSESFVHVVSQPWSVQTWPVPQLAFPVHEGVAGGATLLQP